MTSNSNTSSLIPDTFKVGGENYRVIYDTKYCIANDLFGEVNFTERTIRLAKRLKNRRVTKKEQEQTFFHELVHVLLHAGKEDIIKYNEEFVDKLGILLHEFEKTRKNATSNI